MMQQLLQQNINVDDESVAQALEPARKELQYLGYCPQTLRPLRSRDATLVIHSSHPLKGVRGIPFDAAVFEDALEMPILNMGTKLAVDGGIEICELRTGYNGMSLLGVNNSPDRTLTMRIDCSGSVNTVSHTGSLVAMVTIEPMNAEILLHLLPAREETDWSAVYEVSYRW
jgi:hypothetical protein